MSISSIFVMIASRARIHAAFLVGRFDKVSEVASFHLRGPRDRACSTSLSISHDALPKLVIQDAVYAPEYGAMMFASLKVSSLHEVIEGPRAHLSFGLHPVFRSAQKILRRASYIIATWHYGISKNLFSFFEGGPVASLRASR